MSTTRLAVFCDKFLEATWLAALIVVPLFFDLYSNRIFDQDKISLVRALALLMTGVWAVKQIETGLSRSEFSSALRSNPFIIPVGGIASAWLNATITSVSPAMSFWGSDQRGEGLFTLFSLLAIFLITASTIREQVQLDRAIDVMIVAGFPVALYAIIQHWHFDPVVWDTDVSARVASTIGNPVPLAAYLMMLVPLTLARGWQAVQVNLRRGIVFAVLLLAQLVALIFTQGRGAMIALGCGLLAFVLLYMVLHGRRKIALGAMSAVAAAIVFFVIFNLPNTPLEPLKRVPYLGRFGEVFEGGAATGAAREMIWRGALQLVLPHAPLWSPTTGDDALNIIRPLVGYGPDTLLVVYPLFYPSELGPYEGRYNAPDRSHNETLDALAMTGLMGLLAYLVFLTSIFYWSLEWLGLMSTRAQRLAFPALWCGGGAGVSLLAGLLAGWHWIGVALPSGMFLGFIVFVAVQPRPVIDSQGEARTLWLSALCGVILAYFVEGLSGVGTVTSRLNFWICLALLVVLGTRQLAQPVPHRSRRAGVATAWPDAQVFLWSAIAGLILTILCFDFVGNRTGTIDVLQVVSNSFGASFALSALCLASWIAAGVIGLVDHFKRPRRTLLLFIILPLGITALFVAFQTFWLTQGGDILERLTNLLATFYLSVFMLVVAMAGSLYLNASPRAAPRVRGPVTIIGIPVIIALVGASIYAANFTGIVADVFIKVGNTYYGAGSWGKSIAAFQRARALQPDQDFAALSLGRAYDESASSLNDPTAREQTFRLSEETLLQAQRLNPYNMEYALNLGQMYRAWGMASGTAPARAAHYADAEKHLEVATRLSPHMPYVRNELAQTYLQAGELDRAGAQLDESLRLDATYAQTYFYLGEYYRLQKDDAHAGENYLRALGFDHTALSDPSGKLFEGPLSILSQGQFLPRVLESYRNFSTEFPKSIVPKRALEDLARYQSKK